MHGELLGGVQESFPERAPRPGLKNLSYFLVTFVDMLRNDVTFFESKSVKNVYHFFKRVQIWYQNNIKQLAH